MPDIADKTLKKHLIITPSRKSILVKIFLFDVEVGDWVEQSIASFPSSSLSTDRRVSSDYQRLSIMSNGTEVISFTEKDGFEELNILEATEANRPREVFDSLVEIEVL